MVTAVVSHSPIGPYWISAAGWLLNHKFTAVEKLESFKASGAFPASVIVQLLGGFIKISREASASYWEGKAPNITLGCTDWLAHPIKRAS